MNDEDRFFERQRQNWSHLKRLGVKYAFCDVCGEFDPRCFLGDFARSQIIGSTLHALCERCKRRSLAPTDDASIAKKWEFLRKQGVRNHRCHCGEDNPFCLEADHLAGKKTSKFVIGVCINCHLKRTSRQLTEYPRDSADPQNQWVVMRNTVRGSLEHLELISEGLRPLEKLLHDQLTREPDSQQD